MSVPTGYEMLQFPTRGGQSAGLYNQFSEGVQKGLPDILQKLLSQSQGQGSAFDQLEIGARRGLESELANIGQSFGLSGNQKSSGFQNAIAGVGKNFAEDLYGQRQQLMQKSIQDVLGLGELLLKNPDVENYFMPKDKGFDWGQLLAALAPAAGAAVGGGLGFLGGGPSGALTGAQFGGSLGGKVAQGFR